MSFEHLDPFQFSQHKIVSVFLLLNIKNGRFAYTTFLRKKLKRNTFLELIQNLAFLRNSVFFFFDTEVILMPTRRSVNNW